MSVKKKIISLFTSLLSCLLLFLLFQSGCSSKKSHETIRVGVTAGPHAMIMEDVRKRAIKEGLSFQIIEFNDFILPNQALEQGDIDLNNFQHKPFFHNQVKTRGFKNLLDMGPSVLMPMAAFSHSLKKFEDIQQGQKVAIPNDPTNGGRALKLLAHMGLITLKEGVDNPTPQHITHNPKALKIIEIEAPQLPRILEDVAFAVINIDWIVLADMKPEEAIYKEDKNSPYANIFVSRKDHPRMKDIEKLIEIYRSDETKAFIREKFKGSVIYAWGE